MNYKVSILAMAISAGLSASAFADDWNNGGNYAFNDVQTSVDKVAIDGTGAPVDTNQVNPDGTFKAGCTGCAWVDPATLTQPQRDAIAADPNAALFAGSHDRSVTDQATGDTHTVSRTGAQVKTGEGYSNAGGSTGISAGGVKSTDASGSSSTMSGKGFKFDDGKGGSVTIADPSIVVTDGAGSTTTIHNGDIDATGTISGGKVLAGGRDVGQSLADHDQHLADHDQHLAQHDQELASHDQRLTDHDQHLADHDQKLANHDQRITSVQNQADATDYRLTSFNNTGGTIENWASGVDSWRNGVDVWRNSVDNTLAHYGSEISALQDWRGVATAQISNLQGRMKKVEGGVALATALQVPTLEAGKRFGLNLDFGGVNSTGAVAGGVAIRINDDWQLHAGGGIATNGEAYGGRVGVTWQK